MDSRNYIFPPDFSQDSRDIWNKFHPTQIAWDQNIGEKHGAPAILKDGKWYALRYIDGEWQITLQITQD